MRAPELTYTQPGDAAAAAPVKTTNATNAPQKRLHRWPKFRTRKHSAAILDHVAHHKTRRLSPRLWEQVLEDVRRDIIYAQGHERKRHVQRVVVRVNGIKVRQLDRRKLVPRTTVKNARCSHIDPLVTTKEKVPFTSLFAYCEFQLRKSP